MSKLALCRAQLQIDVGNTRLKWRLRSKNEVAARGFLVWSDFSGPPELLAQLAVALAGAAVESVLVSSVAAAEVAVAIDRWAREQFAVEARFAVVSPRAAGVDVGYDSPELLGVDRWLAVLAASAYQADGVVVVDCGSAVTVDVLCGSQHRGGYIVPGLRLMNAALFQDTARVRVVPDWQLSGLPGRDTASAVSSGLPLMVAGLVNEVWLRQLAQGGEGQHWKVLLTGGDAPLLVSLLAGKMEVLVVEDLVLDGLLLAESRPLECG